MAIPAWSHDPTGLRWELAERRRERAERRRKLAERRRERVERRVERRRARRARGIVISPALAGGHAAPDDSAVRLRGYAALRRVFPAAPPGALLTALAAAAEAPAVARAATAARALIAAAGAALRPSRAPPAPAPPMLNLLRTATVGSCAPAPAALSSEPHRRALPCERSGACAEGLAVRGLRPWLEALGLGSLFAEASVWARDQGACSLEDILDNIEDLASTFRLEDDVLHRFRGDGVREAAAAVPCDSPAPPRTPLHRSMSSPAAVVAQSPAAWPAHGRTPSAVADRRLAPPVDYAAAAGSADGSAPLRACCYQASQDELVRDCTADDPVPRVRHRALFRRPPCARRFSNVFAYKRRVDPTLLRAPIPTPEELGAAEAARRAGQEAQEAQAVDASQVLRSFERMREAFLRAHGQGLRHDLGPGVSLVRAGLAREVQDSFLRTCQGAGAIPDFGYHGTRRANIPGILSRGLLVPGPGTVPVLHGSAHGVGIYTAKPGAVGLSRCFCDSPDMFVCGVVTRTPPQAREAAPAPAPGRPHKAPAHRNHHRPAAGAAVAAGPRMIGHLPVGRDDPIIREVGDARVIFDERYVAPLFVARGAGRRQAAVRIAVRGAGGNVNKRQDRGGANQIFVRETGQRVFLPPEPHHCRHARRIKRVLVARALDEVRRGERAAKEAARGG